MPLDSAALRNDGSRLILASLALLLAGGCGTTKVSGTSRTATEQLLLTNAWDDALKQVDFRPLAGVPVYLDEKYLDGSLDKGWLISSVRQALLAQGVLLRAKPEQAQWIVEARVGVYGTNNYDWLFGVQQTTIPATITGLPSGTIPEIPLAKKSNQQGVVKLALYAYDRASGQVTWNSGTDAGPFRRQGRLHRRHRAHPVGLDPQRDRVHRRSASRPFPTSTRPRRSRWCRPQGDVPFHAPTLSLPSSAADATSFAP